MKKIISIIGKIIIVAMILDALVLMATIGQIASGEPTPHIPFWDAQIKVIANIL